jgi:hypothetical protein
MKTTELKGYGLTGVKAEFSLMDCYEASHMMSRIKAIHEDTKDGTIVLDNVSVELLSMLDMVNNFLEKIALKPSEMSSIFLPKEEENNEKECYL